MTTITPKTHDTVIVLMDGNPIAAVMAANTLLNPKGSLIVIYSRGAYPAKNLLKELFVFRISLTVAVDSANPSDIRNGIERLLDASAGQLRGQKVAFCPTTGVGSSVTYSTGGGSLEDSWGRVSQEAPVYKWRNSAGQLFPIVANHAFATIAAQKRLNYETFFVGDEQLIPEYGGVTIPLAPLPGDWLELLASLPGHKF